MDDWELVQKYVREGSQEAFAQIVRRHVGWVREAARRQVGDADLADDVAQAVFLALARQAHKLHRGAALSTWLFQVTRYASSAARRSEARRKRHERQAAMKTDADETSMTPAQWERLAGVLDRTVARLRGVDQRAVLLRFYEQKTYPQIAADLGVSEEAARKRTDRAVERLRELLAGRELMFSAAVLSQGLLAHVSAPAALSLEGGAIAMGVCGAAAGGGAAGAGVAGVAGGGEAMTSIETISQGAVRMLKLTNLRVPLAACAGLLVVVAVGVAALDAGSAPPAATQPSAPLAATPAPQPAADAQSPKEVIFAAFRAAAAGDAKGLIARFDNPTPTQTQTLEDVTRIMAATERLSDAIRERFGADVESSISRALGVGVAAFDVAAANETIDGDRAIVSMDAGPGEIHLVRIGQTWKISPEVLATLNARALTARTPAIQRLAEDIGAGKYETAQSLRDALAGMMRGGRGQATTTSRAASPGVPAGGR